MNKNLLILFFLMLSFPAFACECISENFTEKYMKSDFAAVITITKVYPNVKNSHVYKADIEISELFKGERLQSIYVYGRSDNNHRVLTSCDIFIPVNTKLIAYAEKNNEGKYEIGMCSGLVYLNGKNSKKERLELDILKAFQSKNIINFTNKTDYRDIGNLHTELDQFNGIELQKKYGIYEIAFNPDSTIKEVKEISGFGMDIDDKIIQILSKSKWSVSKSEKKDAIPAGNEFLIGIYYYEAEKGNSSFLSDNYLY